MSSPVSRRSRFARSSEIAHDRHGARHVLARRDNSSPPVPGPLILIIDDDAGTCETFLLALGREGFRVRTARCAIEGISVALGHAFDLMLIDQALPDMLGTQMIRTLQSDGSIAPFALMSAFLTTPITVEAMRLGAIDVLEKPISVDDLPTRVDSALRRRATVVQSIVLPADERVRAVPVVECSHQVQAASAAERWAMHVINGCYSTTDLKTVEQWAVWVRVSCTSLRESCRLIDVRPHDARDLMRMLRAVMLACLHECAPAPFLDVSDGRTLESLFERSGLESVRPHVISVADFLQRQRFVRSDSIAFRTLRGLITRHLRQF
jgi:DNA-binding response OmpR family regulator